MEQAEKEVFYAQSYEPKFGNLHFHTEHSDNMRSVETVVKRAKEEGFKGLGITDHDTITGWGEFRELCQQEGLEYILGAEFYGNAFGVSFHLTSYDFDPENEGIKALLQLGKDREQYKTRTRFELGVARGTIKGITWEEVVEYNKGINFIFHAHVSRAMIAKGVLKPEDRNEFRQVNFVAKNVPITGTPPAPEVKDVIETVKAAGGVTFMAHPSYQDREEYMEAMIELGVQGIELWHPSNRGGVYEKIEELIAKHNLYTGGGTDHHGYMEGCPFYEVGSDKNRDRSVPRAMFGVSEEHFRQLKERALG